MPSSQLIFVLGMDQYDDQGDQEAPPKVIRKEVSADVSDDDVEDALGGQDSSKLSRYAFHVARDVVLGLQKGLRNIVPHYFNDHSGAQHPFISLYLTYVNVVYYNVTVTHV